MELLKDITKPGIVNRVVTSYRYFIGYYHNVNNDTQTAKMYLGRALSLAPEDEQLLQMKNFFSNK